MSDYSKLPPIAVSLGGFAFNGEHIEYWKTQATKADREIASLRAQRDNAVEGCDVALARVLELEAQLASARKVVDAARAYFNYAVQDEAAERECCVDDEQHERAKALRDALADEIREAREADDTSKALDTVERDFR